MNFVKSQDQVPELETIMTEYWDCKRELNVVTYPEPIYVPEGDLPCDRIVQTWSVILFGAYYDLDTGTGCEIFRVRQGSKQYYTSADGKQLYEVGN